jgi:hypothetical protein
MASTFEINKVAIKMIAPNTINNMFVNIKTQIYKVLVGIGTKVHQIIRPFNINFLRNIRKQGFYIYWFKPT